MACLAQGKEEGKEKTWDLNDHSKDMRGIKTHLGKGWSLTQILGSVIEFL